MLTLRERTFAPYRWTDVDLRARLGDAFFEPVSLPQRLKERLLDEPPPRPRELMREALRAALRAVYEDATVG